jgi:phytanoyl-CoA hydroxylase
MVYRGHFDAVHGLSVEARDAFSRDGVIVLQDFVPAAQCDLLKQRALELIEKFAPAASGTVFSTRDNRHAKDAYFEQSANGIGVFFEECALDAEGKLCVSLERAVNKIGHAMHDLDPVFNAFSRGNRLQAVADGIGLDYPKLVQSMYIFKQPGIGGEVVCHQDSTYIYTEPQSVVGFWFAIEDAHRGNGCLAGLPGEHRNGLREIYRKHGDGQLKMDTIQPDLAWDMRRLEWLEAPKGTLIVFNGAFPHLSEPNRSAESRHAYTLHAVSGRAHYSAGNWIQRPHPTDMPFTGFV